MNEWGVYTIARIQISLGILYTIPKEIQNRASDKLLQLPENNCEMSEKKGTAQRGLAKTAPIWLPH